MADASPTGKSVTGGTIMLAGGVLLELSLRQHLVSPDPTTSEIVAAGSVCHILHPIGEVLQEISVRLGEPVPFWVDSRATYLVGNSDTAVKKSAWLQRRVEIHQEAQKIGDIHQHLCTDRDMLADSNTKYIPFDKWNRLFHIKLNRDGDPPKAIERNDQDCE